MSKKILFLMEFPIDLPGGGQMSTWTLCDGLIGSDYEPVVACPTLLSKSPEDFNFRIEQYSSDENREKNKFLRISNFVKRIGDFYRIIKKVNPDIIHVSMSESLITYGFLRCLGIFKKIPFVYTDRGLCYGYRKHSKTCILMTMKHAGRMICTTQFNKNLWSKENLTCGINVIPNTISSAFDDFDASKRPLMREKYGIKDGEFVIGFAGRISEEKDWDFVPTLVKVLADAGLKFKVALVISVYEAQDTEIVKMVKDGITASIGEDNLIYMQDLNQKEIADYYYMVDAFIMSSMFESFGKAAVEAMSRKCSVVSTSVGGLTEVIGKEENLYTKDTLDKYVTRIKELIDSPEELERDREYFYHRYKDNYTREVHVNRHIALYDEVISKA